MHVDATFVASSRQGLQSLLTSLELQRWQERDCFRDHDFQGLYLAVEWRPYWRTHCMSWCRSTGTVDLRSPCLSYQEGDEIQRKRDGKSAGIPQLKSKTNMKNLRSLLRQRRRDTLCPVEILLCYHACVMVCKAEKAASTFRKRRNVRKAIITQSVQGLDGSACLCQDQA